MAGLPTMIIRVLFVAFILVATSGRDKYVNAERHGGHGHRHPPCTNDGESDMNGPPCDTTASSTTDDNEVMDNTVTTTSESTTEYTTDDTSTLSSTNLERAHWCRLNNGSYMALGSSFMNTVCTICQCTASHLVRCQMLECLPTYCIDNSKPIVKSGQCCTQCSYDPEPTACTYNGTTYAHGAIMKTIAYKVQCWCYFGAIECRDYRSSLWDGLDIMGDGAIAFIIIVVVGGVLLLGLLVCLCGTFLCSYYYQQYQQTIQQAYDEYVSSAGWQPIEEEQYDENQKVEEKQFEAENYQYSDVQFETGPPPYAGQDDSSASDDKEKLTQ